MDDGEILQHLLEIEAKASILVDDAQAEADKRLKQAEEQNRAAYEEQYRSLVEKLTTEYDEQIGAARSEYQRTLDAYRSSLDTMPVNTDAFCALAFSLFCVGEK
jgi:vacuolar-type H+-ATPase subunit H